MKILFSGGSESVTGSSHLFEIGGRKVLIDCGLYQGKDVKERENEQFLFDPASVDFVLVSHAHIDHTGRLPLLYKRGFKGKIYATEPTMDLCKIMLLDSAFIQEQDAERDNRKRERKGMIPQTPLYTVKDAEEVLKLFTGKKFGEIFELYPGLKVRFTDSGHMLGSSFVELFIQEEGRPEIKVAFSSDLGNHNIPLIKEPTSIDEADILLLESTYGNRLHEPQANENEKLIRIINDTVRRGGNVVIPSFAVGRTQEIIYILDEYAEKGLLDPQVRVIVDSPLASKATEVFKNYTEYLDDEAKALMAKGDDIFDFRQLSFTETVDDSRLINEKRSGNIIISASGMADAGRVRHHLKHNLWREECSVVFVGYQAEGTLGKMLLDGEKDVKLFGEEVHVEAKIYQMSGLSGHADRNGLIEWTDKFKEKPKKIYLVHGDPEARESLAGALLQKGYNVESALYGKTVEINNVSEIAPVESTMTVTPEMIRREGMKRPSRGIEYKPETKVSDSVLRDEIIRMLNSKDVDKMPKEELLKELAVIIYGRG